MSKDRNDNKSLRKLVVIFPGAGYHQDKPYLYYAINVAKSLNYDIVVANYQLNTFDMNDIDSYINHAIENIQFLKEQIKNYDQIISVEKSIGTCIAGKFFDEFNVKVKRIVLTPLEFTLPYLKEDDIVVCGMCDPLFQEELIKKIDFIGCKVYHYESANHSLEIKDDWIKTIDYLKQTVAIFQEVMEG